jgi:hypothetical protein
MKTITKSVIKLSEIPKHLQEMFKGHKIHTYAEFHIDDDCNDDLSLWLIDKYPTIKMKVSFLIHIDIEKQQQGYSEEDLREAFKQSRQAFIFEKDMPPVYNDFEEWFEQFKNK